ncbi:amidohydrolase [Massilia glaciei]|uniref:Amidohydrolase n=2 Tax=Massilia glaciei TaxID=1524097 RepID=A0A2U2HGR4_9BURK|nr:amidohydrolase [Massilia glaciei]
MAGAADTALGKAIARDYDAHLAPLFDHLHRNPELSYQEFKTAARMAGELRAAGFEVTGGVGKTGVVAILRNGPGPMVMLRADMDGLPVLEKSGLSYASKVTQKDDGGREVPVSHACGHDVHMTSMVGTARQMAGRRAEWSGTLMLLAQPAEERIGGARDMMSDNLWQRFGKPDFALALHVASGLTAGTIDVSEAPYSGVDSLEIIVHGLGAHGAAPHTGKDPVVIGAQIVMALQTITSRELSPREPGLITVGSFHAGTKGNIISDTAKLELTVRSESVAARELLLKAITRVTLNTARAAGIAENMLPEIKVTDDPAPPVLNDPALSERLKAVWRDKLGGDIFSTEYKRGGMGAEDFVNFTSNPYIPSVYFRVGGTSAAEMAQAARSGTAVPSNHSPLFKVVPDVSIKTGVATSVVALLDLLKKK